eukprot:SAG22_NODE_17373_length_306_cov_0.743961_1_plen_83_part_10
MRSAALPRSVTPLQRACLELDSVWLVYPARRTSGGRARPIALGRRDSAEERLDVDRATDPAGRGPRGDLTESYFKKNDVGSLH